MKKTALLLLALICLLTAAVILYLSYDKRSSGLQNEVYIVESPKPYETVPEKFTIKGRSKHTNGDLIYFWLTDTVKKNDKGNPLGLNAGSIFIKEFQEDGYGTFFMKLESKYPQSSGHVMLETYTYDPSDTALQKRVNIQKINFNIEQD